MPKRSASARAFGKSVSQMACTSTLRIFFSTGRCATWVIAPPPTIPTLRRSLVVPLRPPVMVPPSSVAALQPGTRIVGRKNLLVTLPGAGASDRAPLAEADAVAGTRAVDHQLVTFCPAPVAIRLNAVLRSSWPPAGRKTCLILAVAVHLTSVPPKPDGELIDPARGRALGDPDIGHRADRCGVTSRSPGDRLRCKVARSASPRPLLPPADSGARCCSRPRRSRSWSDTDRR